MRRPTWIEALLLVILAVVLTALFVRGGGQAYAGGGGGTNSVLALVAEDVGGTRAERAELLYLIDTAKQRVCIYRWTGSRLGLVSAREYAFDMELLETTGDKSVETFEGASRGYVKAQVESYARRRRMFRRRNDRRHSGPGGGKNHG
jgi:PHD/YefM family antitoxin component YafN of YafNO toxin-antitoxin module